MSASDHLDMLPADARATTPDVSDNGFSVEDAEADYQSRDSYISDKDEDGTAENNKDGELELLQWNSSDRRWEAIRASDMEDVVGPSMNRREWLSLIEHTTWHNALISNRERCLDALAVLSETVGGVARQLWCETLSDQEMHGVNANCFPVLQALVILIMSSKAAVTDTIWWDFCTLYIPSQRIFHFSFDSSFLEGRFVMDFSPDRRSKDLAEVMRISLPYFREMKARLNALSSNIGHSSDSASILGPSNLANLITCLDIAESISKLVPVFGDVLEGACGILRKTVQAAEVARSARNECRALAEHTASITLAILNEFGPTSVLSGGDFNRICDLRDTIKIVDS